MGPFVAVHVEPTPADPRELAALVEACSRALPRGECHADADAASEPPAATASVHWLDEWHVHIETHVDGNVRQALERDLTFSSADARRERFRSVGLAIATILDEVGVGREPAPAASPPADATAGAPSPSAASSTPTRPSAPTSAANPGLQLPPSDRAPVTAGARTPSRTHGWSAELGGLLATGVAGRAPRVGPYARFAYAVSLAPLFLDGRVSYAWATTRGAPDVGWFDVALGAGAYSLLGPVRVELGIRAVLSRTSASAPNPTTNVNDTEARLIPGLGMNVCAAWPVSGPLSATLGADGTWVARELTITNAGQEIGHVSAYNVGILAGARLHF